MVDIDSFAEMLKEELGEGVEFSTHDDLVAVELTISGPGWAGETLVIPVGEGLLDPIMHQLADLAQQGIEFNFYLRPIGREH